MKALFNHIASRITTAIPTLKVELFNSQFAKANIDRTEKAIIYPICYVEFIVESVNNYCLGVKDYMLRIRFRLGIEGYKFQRPETFDFVDTFYQAIHMMRPPVPDGGLYFTSFQEYSPEFDEDHDNVDKPYIDYRTRLRTTVAYTALEANTPTVDLDLQTEIVDEI